MQNEQLRGAQGELDSLLQEYSQLYDFAPVGYISLSEQGLIVKSNLTAASLLGHSRSRIVERPFSRFVLKEDQAVHFLSIEKLKETGLPQAYELRVARTGGRFWCKVEANLSPAQNGKAILRLILSDISDSKEAQEALRQKDLRYRLIVENAGMGIGEADPDGRMVTVNEELCRILGRPREDIIGKVGRDFIYPPDRAKADQLHEDMSAGRIDRFQEELRYFNPDGKIVWTYVTGTCWREPATGLAQRIAIIEDITERKETERQISEYKTSLEATIKERTARVRQLSSVFLNATDPIIIEDLSGKIIEVNREAVRVYGYTREELIGSPVSMLFLPERHKRAEMLRKRCRLGEELRNVDGIRQSKSGKCFAVLMSAFPLHDDHEQVAAIATIAKDITRRKQVENALCESQARLTELSRKTIETLENDRRAVSRELHDAIGANLAAIKFMVEEAAEQSEHSCSTILNKANSYLLDTIKEVKRISINLRPLTLDDLGLIPTLKGKIRDVPTQYGMKCKCRIAVSEQDVPETTKIVIYRIFQEALANAGKHSQATRLGVRLHKKDDQIVLTIRDNGCGFDSSNPCPRDPLGGYGIKSMRERVEICGGEFSIESKPGKGTIVRARFPVSS